MEASQERRFRLDALNISNSDPLIIPKAEKNYLLLQKLYIFYFYK